MTDTPPPRPIIIQIISDPNVQRWIERIIMAILATYFGLKINTVSNSVESTKDVATVSAQKSEVAAAKADKAADVGVKNLAINTAQIDATARNTLDPQAIKAAEEAKKSVAEVKAEATTQADK